MPNLKTIIHKFWLKGHTHMEVDGVHSVIKTAKKRFPKTQSLLFREIGNNSLGIANSKIR